MINVRQAIVTTAEGKQASAELQTQFASRQNELEGMNKQINDLRQQLQAGATTLSEEEKARLPRRANELAAQLGTQEKRNAGRRECGAGRSGGPDRPEDDGCAGPLRARKRIRGDLRFVVAEFADSLCLDEH